MKGVIRCGLSSLNIYISIFERCGVEYKRRNKKGGESEVPYLKVLGDKEKNPLVTG